MLSASQIITPKCYGVFRNWTRQRLDYVHFVGLKQPPRPGIVPFITALEYQHFTPGSPFNEVFSCVCVEWLGMLWYVASIPKGFAFLADDLGRYFGISMTTGIPMVEVTIRNQTRHRRFPIAFEISNLNIVHIDTEPMHPFHTIPDLDLVRHLRWRQREDQYVERLRRGEAYLSSYMKAVFE